MSSISESIDEGVPAAATPGSASTSTHPDGAASPNDTVQSGANGAAKPASPSPPLPPASKTAKKSRKSAGITIDPPAIWLRKIAARHETFTEEHLKELGTGAWQSVFLVLMRTPLEVEQCRFAVEYWDDEVLPGMSRLEWLCGLGAELDKIPLDERLDKYLCEKHGEVYFEVQQGKNVACILNQLRFATSFLIERYVTFDNDTKVFRQYMPESGIWRTISDEAGLKLLMQYATGFIKDAPALYPATNRFFRDIFSSCRPLGLPNPDSSFNAYSILGVRNGAIALKTDSQAIPGRSPDEAVHHAMCSPSHNVQNVIPVDYDASKTTPTKFLEFLAAMMSRDEQDMLQRWLGMVLLGKNYFHRILIISGDAGSGKSTLINLIEKMIGKDNVGTLNTYRLEDRFELSEFFGKTLLIGRDVGADFLNNKSAHMLKSLSGDTGIKAEVKYVQQRVRLAGPFNIVMTSNSDLRLELHGDSSAWERRLLVINVRPKGGRKEIIQDLEEKLIQKEGSAILNWMLNGAQEVLKWRRLNRDFELAAAQRLAVSNLLGRSDTISEFVRIDVRRGAPSDEVATEDLYAAYENFCARAEVDPLPRTVFQKRIVRIIFKMHGGVAGQMKTQPGRDPRRGYLGVQIQLNAEDPPATTSTTAAAPNAMGPSAAPTASQSSEPLAPVPAAT